MKRHISQHIAAFFTIALMLTAVSCNKDSDVTTLKINSEQYRPTGKVYIDADNYCCWQTGDAVNVNNTAKSIEQRNGCYCIPGVEVSNDGYTATYPTSVVANATIDHANGRIHNVVLPAEQTYTLINGRQCLPTVMAATSNTPTGSIHFHNAGIVLQMTLLNTFGHDVDVCSVIVSDNLAPLSGVFDIDGINNGTPTLSYCANGDSTHSVTLTIPEKIRLSAHEDVTLFIALPPTDNYEGNRFTITVNTYDARNPLTLYQFIHTQSATANGQIARNIMAPMAIDLNDPDYTATITPLKGNGTASNPYLIRTVTDLQNMQVLVNMGYIPATSSDTPYAKAYYKVANDIDLNGVNLAPIGTAKNNFHGSFDGQNHTLSNLKVGGTKSAGLFGYTQNAQIHDVIVAGADITTTNAKDAVCGVLCGQANVSLFNHCRILGEVRFHTQSGSAYVGGLVGECNYNSRIFNCHCGAILHFETGTPAHYLGGIVGHVINSSHVINSYTRISTRHDSFQEYTIMAGNAYAGGLVGRSDDGTYTNKNFIENCYFGLNEKIAGHAERTADICAWTSANQVIQLCLYRNKILAIDYHPSQARNIQFAPSDNGFSYYCTGGHAADQLNNYIYRYDGEMAWHVNDQYDYHEPPEIL